MDSSHPSHPDFWNSRYLSGQTPWDFGGVPANLKAYLRIHPKGGRVLIPGCGSGYEIKAFADAGYDVTAIDLAPAAVERARHLAGPAFTGKFLCALLPDRREAYRDRVAALLKPRGMLIGYFYYATPDLAAGPPFGFAWATADELFARYFLLLKDLPVADSLPVFQGRERWQEQSRTPYTGGATNPGLK